MFPVLPFIVMLDLILVPLVVDDIIRANFPNRPPISAPAAPNLHQAP